jgi:hypothetical protein
MSQNREGYGFDALMQINIRREIYSRPGRDQASAGRSAWLALPNHH